MTNALKVKARQLISLIFYMAVHKILLLTSHGLKYQYTFEIIITVSLNAFRLWHGPAPCIPWRHDPVFAATDDIISPQGTLIRTHIPS